MAAKKVGLGVNRFGGFGCSGLFLVCVKLEVIPSLHKY